MPHNDNGLWREVFCYRRHGEAAGASDSPDHRSRRRFRSTSSDRSAHKHYRAAYLHKLTGEVRFSGSPIHIADWAVQRVLKNQRADPSTHRSEITYFNVITRCTRSYRWASPAPFASVAEEVDVASRGTPQWFALHDSITGRAFYQNSQSGACVWASGDHVNDFCFEEVDLFGQEDEVVLPEFHSSADLNYFIVNHAIGQTFPLHRFAPKRYRFGHQFYGRGSRSVAGEPSAFLIARPPTSLHRTQASPLDLAKHRSRASSAGEQGHLLDVSNHPGDDHGEPTPNAINSKAMKRQLIKDTIDENSSIRHGAVDKDVARIREAVLGPGRDGNLAAAPMVLTSDEQAILEATKHMDPAAREEHVHKLVEETARSRGHCWRRIRSTSDRRHYYVLYSHKDLEAKDDTQSIGSDVVVHRTAWRLPECPAGYRPKLQKITGIVTWRRVTPSQPRKSSFKKSPSFYELHHPERVTSFRHDSTNHTVPSVTQTGSSKSIWEATVCDSAEVNRPQVAYDPTDIAAAENGAVEGDSDSDEAVVDANWLDLDQQLGVGESQNHHGKFDFDEDEEDEEDEGGFLAALMQRPRRASKLNQPKVIAPTPRTLYMKSRSNSITPRFADFDEVDSDSEDDALYLQRSLRRQRRVVDAGSDEEESDDDSFASYSD